MADVLVAHYSRTGTTAVAARRLADALGADLEAIRVAPSYGGGLGFLRCIFEATRRDLPEIETGRDPAAYRLVIVGSPVWAGCLASPVRAYLTRWRDRLPHMAAFCTSGSGSAEAVFAEIQEIVGDRPLLATLSLSQDAVVKGTAAERITAWARDLEALGRAVPAAA